MSSSSTSSSLKYASDGLRLLIDVHQDVTDYIKFQSNVQYPVILLPRKEVEPMTKEEATTMLGHINNERRLMTILRSLLEIADQQAEEVVVALGHKLGSEWVV